MPADIVRQLDSIQPEQFASELERFQAKEAARHLLARLETPFERAWSLASENSMLVAGLLTTKDLGIWERWAEVVQIEGSETAKSLADITAMCKADAEPDLLRRILRQLSAMAVIHETDVDTWKPTPFSLALAGEVGKVVQCCPDHMYMTALNLPKFLAKIGYVQPLDLSKFDNYADTFGDTFWERCGKDPAIGDSFAAIMRGITAFKGDWTNVYDTNRLVSDADLSSGAPPLFVDVGGRHGIDTARLLARHPPLPPNLLIVQDLPEVVEEQIKLNKQAAEEGRAHLDDRITHMPHDFYQEQPLTGARAYFLHAVLHDWPDSDCAVILGRIRDAMRRGYSKLLVYEIVLPPKGASAMMCTLDMCLMDATSGLERTEAHWQGLLEAAGFRVVRIDRDPRAVECVIEAELE